MKDVEKLVREDVKKLAPYVCARDLYKEAEVFLDANENSFGSPISFEGVELNRYPDSDLVQLRGELASYLGGGLSVENLMVGNGSDEIIDLAIRTFAEKGDNIVCLDPAYPMFQVCAEISGVGVRKVLLDAQFQPDIEKTLAAVDGRTKMIFVVSPNSLVGNEVERSRLESLLKESGVVVFLDEAYGDFTGKTLASLVKKYENLLVSKTFSKAWGLAGLRVGYAIACAKLIDNMRKLKPPYNVGVVANSLALKALKSKGVMQENLLKMRIERSWVYGQLKLLKLEVLPSVANFLTFRVPKEFDSKSIQKQIAAKGVIIRDRSAVPRLENCIRVTIGTRRENELFLAALREVLGL